MGQETEIERRIGKERKSLLKYDSNFYPKNKVEVLGLLCLVTTYERHGNLNTQIQYHNEIGGLRNVAVLKPTKKYLKFHGRPELQMA